MTLRSALIAGSLALALAVAGPAAGVLAAPAPPLDMTAAMGPPAPTPPRPGKVPACRLFIAGVEDKRSDTATMGYMGMGMVLSSDAPGWVRSGLITLQGDARWTFAATAEDADLVLNVEILKSYIFAVSTSKAASVVLRIRYSQAGAPLGENLYRGGKEAINWAGGKGESQGLLNQALMETVALTKADLAKGCSAAKAPKPA
ncbi:MAG: hypothetical protein JWR84_2730 [Caulobacter sp.]|nr:hypothetical protein [Caulobacter sp.]